jgi:hypothetical protein
MVFLFGWASKDAGKNTLGLVLLLATSISLPFAASSISSGFFQLQTKANLLPQITNLETIPIDNGQILVNISLAKPATVYLKYQDSKNTFSIPVLPTSTFSLRTQHSFILNPDSPQGGTATIVIDNQDYLYKGKALEIKPQ